jgi:hypothetical protein
MSVLQEVIKGLKTEDRTQIIRELCDKIQEEEKSSIEHISNLPKGPNVFLALEVPGRNLKEVAFLSLEREPEDVYIAVLSSISKSKLSSEEAVLKRQKVWMLPDGKAEFILTQYAKTYKYLRGE